MNADLPSAYRLGVGVCLFNADHQVFVGQRRDMISDAWQMPQGGIDKGEDPLVAARRELEEETSVVNASLVYETQDWLTYDLPIELIPKLWGGKYRGQKQKWYLFRFEGPEAEINIQTAEPEFREWKWLALDQVVGQIVPFKRALYTQVISAFAPVLDAES